MITQGYLKECFHYNPDTGVFTWKERPRAHFATERGWKISNSGNTGNAAGTLNGRGYLQNAIDMGYGVLVKFEHNRPDDECLNALKDQHGLVEHLIIKYDQYFELSILGVIDGEEDS